MKMFVMMLHESDKHSLREVKGYEIDESGAAVHRAPLDEGKWSVSDIATGCTVGPIYQTKKLAMSNFREEYADKLVEYRKNPEYLQKLKVFKELESAKESLEE